MGFFDKIFKKKEPATDKSGKTETSINSYEDFWEWFVKNEQTFAKVATNGDAVEKLFFDPITEKLNQLKDGYLMLVGMLDNQIELVITADGSVKNFVFVEELVAAAPQLPGWKFTALKPGLGADSLAINMGNFSFDKNTLAFYPNTSAEYPDEIDITLTYTDFGPDEYSQVFNGAYLFLDNTLGELELATTIDNIDIVPKAKAQDELIPIEKLSDYLVWRQKEFVEKYEHSTYNGENDNYTAIEGKTENGNGVVAIINTGVLHWDAKASHPWMLNIKIEYNSINGSGMPDGNVMEQLSNFEDSLTGSLKAEDGYLYLGRQTGNNARDIYFACREFRKPSKVVNDLMRQNPDLQGSFEIYKDKYWQTMSPFMRN